MKNVYISTIAAVAVLAAGSAFANDLVDADPFFNNVANGTSVAVESVAAASTSDFNPSQDDIFSDAFGPDNAH